MDYIKPVLSVAEKIYTLCNKVRANRKRCFRLRDRIKILVESVEALQTRGVKDKEEDVNSVLQGLKNTLDDAKEFVEKNTKEKWLTKVIQVSQIEQKFTDINERLTSAYQGLSLLLHAEEIGTLKKAFEKLNCEKEDKEDALLDKQQLEILLQLGDEIKGEVRSTKDSVEAGLKEIRDMIDANSGGSGMGIQPARKLPEISEIKRYDLEIDVELFPETAFSHKIYKGKYHKFPVAIKRFTDTKCSKREVQEIFRKEVETMKTFECPNILRMYGICIVESDCSPPDFLIVMEYCELGTLRNVLDNSELELTWQDRIRMSLDAARGLYRLHQSGEKFRVHGCINSSRFMVAKGLQVKLGGFELAQTETSLKRNIRTGKRKSVRSMPYMSPEQLKDINHPYTKECEIYSFGIVLWEIATRGVPFKEYSDKQISEKVREEHYREPLPSDCPPGLQDIINACYSHDKFLRPQAGVIVDKLERIENK